MRVGRVLGWVALGAAIAYGQALPRRLRTSFEARAPATAQRELLLESIIPQADTEVTERLDVLVPAAAGDLQTQMPVSVDLAPLCPAVSTVAADLAVVVSVAAEDSGGAACAGVLGSAAVCTRGPDGRPTSGVVRLCGSLVQRGSVLAAAATLAHELVHLLGFDTSSFPFWRGGEGTAIIVSGTRRLLVTPAVVTAVRHHFGCSTAPGLPLEADGGVGTAYRHAEMVAPQRTPLRPALTAILCPAGALSVLAAGPGGDGVAGAPLQVGRARLGGAERHGLVPV